MTNKKVFFSSLLIAIVLPAIVYLAIHLYSSVLENTPPIINEIQIARGIGFAPVRYTFEVEDKHSGLDEVIVRLRQREKTHIILKQKLNGEKKKTINIDFPIEKINLRNGSIELQIRTFDKSFFNNKNEKSYELIVDTEYPHLKTLTTQHNFNSGGSQLISYEAYDENLILQGIKYGMNVFFGFPAKSIDPSFDQKSHYISLFPNDIRQNLSEERLRIFAEDAVGNVTSEKFFYRHKKRSFDTQTKKLDEIYARSSLIPFYEENFANLKKENETHNSIVEKLSFVINKVYEKDRLDLDNKLKQKSSFEKLWEGPFLKAKGTVVKNFGTTINYLYKNQETASELFLGYEIKPSNKKILAANSGIVIYSGQIGTFGNVIAIDHGLGLVSLYAYLEKPSLSTGDEVYKGQLIGKPGKSGIGNGKTFYFELRLQGVPVDPQEWWNTSWYYSHIEKKIEDVKKKMGIPVKRRL